ncbi:MAG: RecQ family ATP-dependent DNA helicase, partial [Bdellovibrionota bacterium]
MDPNSKHPQLDRYFHFDRFRPGQEPLVEAVMAGRDALAVMPTGGGKSLCFQYPATVLPGTALVISPLIALMRDQVDGLRAKGIRASAYHSGLTQPERWRVREEFLRQDLKLLYLAPERLQSDEFKTWLARVPVSFIAIDEAHCISQWGHDFRPDYRRLDGLRALIRGGAAIDVATPLPIIALTATATRQVQDDIVERLQLQKPVRVITGFRRPNLAFAVKACATRDEKHRQLASCIDEAHRAGGVVVVYAATRKNVEQVAQTLKQLARYRNKVGYYHAGLEDEARTEAQQ